MSDDYEGYCALLRSGGVKCWGLNIDGALGDGGRGTYSNVPVTVKGLADAASLASDYYGYCALLRSGGVKCWGDDSGGQLGDGGREAYSNVPVTVKGLADAARLVGSNHGGYCALLRSGGAKCWGLNIDGALGDGSSEKYSNVPVTVKGLAGAASLVSDEDGYCALLRSGGAKCWGANLDGALGAGGRETQSNVPITVKALAGATSLVGNGFGTGYCALLRSGGAKCWGYNLDGALGDGGREAYSNVPVTVKGLAGAASLVGDAATNYCALLRSGGVKCWGYDSGGQLGDGGGKTWSNVPVTVKGLAGAASLVGSGYRGGYCAVLHSGAAECWGANGEGALGDGSGEKYSNVPVTVKGLAGAASLVSDQDYSYCALLRNGSAKCWGYNGEGALGDGGSEKYSNVPVTVKGLGN